MQKIILSAAAAFLMATTASPSPTFAQDMPAQGEIIVTGKYQKMWDKGSKLEADSLKKLEKARDKLIKYSSHVVGDQNSRDTARQQAERASADFRNLTGVAPAFSDPGEASRWANKVADAARDWAKHDDRRMESRSRLDKNAKRQADAQKNVDRAQADVDKARAMKAEAERMSQLMAAR